MNVKKLVVVLAASSFLGGSGYGIMLPLLPKYADVLGASPFVITLIVGAFPLFKMGTTYILGFFYNRFDGKHLLIIGLGLGSVSAFLVAHSTEWTSLLLLRMVMGIGSGTAGLASSTILSVVLKESDKKGKYFGMLSSLSFISSMMVGPFLAALFYTALGDLSLIFVVIGLLFLMSVGVIVIFLDSQKINSPSLSLNEVVAQIKGEVQSLVKPGSFRYSINAIGLVQGGAVGFLSSVIMIFLYTDVGMSVQEVGLLMMTAGIFGIICRPLVGHMCDTLDKVVVAASGFLARIVAVLLLLLALRMDSPFFFIFLGAVFYTYATASINLSLLTLVSQTEQKERMGMTMSRLSVASSTGELVIPPVGGLLYQETIHEAPLYFLIVTCVAAFPMIRLLQKSTNAGKGLE
jgi:MFS family permease